MVEGLKYLWGVLIVLNDLDPRQNRTWKRFVGSVVSLLLVGSIIGIAWAQGWIPNVSGVALADDLKTFKAEVQQKQKILGDKQDRLALLIVKGALRNALRDRCLAVQRKNQAALDAANSSLDDLTDQFRALAQTNPEIPDCKVVLIDDAIQ